MKTVILFVTIISSLECFSAEEPSVYVRVSMDIEWRRFCYFIPLFREKLSEEVYDMEVVIPYEVSETRVRIMNEEVNCRGQSNSEDAEVDFFISQSEEDLGPSYVDRNITIQAYKVLFDYWRNKKMLLLDPIFRGKVNKVELMGRDKPDISEGLTEETRIGIGIVVGLTVAFTIALIFLGLSARKQMKKRPPHGIPMNVLPPEPTITMIDDPEAHNHYRQDKEHQRQQESKPQYYLQDSQQEYPRDYRQDYPRDHQREYSEDYPRDYSRDHPQDYPKEYPQDYAQEYQKEDRQDGYARQSSGSYNGYAAKHDVTYEEEPLGSPML